MKLSLSGRIQDLDLVSYDPRAGVYNNADGLDPSVYSLRRCTFQTDSSKRTRYGTDDFLGSARSFPCSGTKMPGRGQLKVKIFGWANLEN